MWSRFKFGFLLVCLLTSSTQCGYTLSHRLQPQFRDPRGVFIPVFDNKSDETGAERVFTAALIREIQSRHEIKLSDRSQGALELKGRIDSIDYSPTAYTIPGFNGLESYRRIPSELGVGVMITLSLVDPKSNNLIWQKQFSGFRRVDAPITRTYDFQSPSSLGMLHQSLAESTYELVAGDVMRDIYDDMVELF